jgi:hypothetical protein
MSMDHAIKTRLELLETLPVGIVHLNADREVVAMNDHARAILPIDAKRPFGRMVSQFHTARARTKVEALLDETAVGCPLSQQASLTMMIDIPDRVLLIKLSQVSDEAQQSTGFTLVFFDVTDSVSVPSQADGSTPTAAQLRLTQIPTIVDRQVRFVPIQSVTCLESSAHSTRVYTKEAVHSCNLSIGDLETRLDPRQFVRVHRRFIVNLEQVTGLNRAGTRTHVTLQGEASPEVPVSRESVTGLKRALKVPKGVALRAKTGAPF